MTATPEHGKTSEWKREKNFINGEWIASDSGRSFPVEDPATGEKIGSMAWSGADETRHAIDAAQSAFADWSMTSAAQRASLLHKMANIIREHLEDLACLLTLEQGKPLAEARGDNARRRLCSMVCRRSPKD